MKMTLYFIKNCFKVYLYKLQNKANAITAAAADAVRAMPLSLSKVNEYLTILLALTICILKPQVPRDAWRSVPDFIVSGISVSCTHLVCQFSPFGSAFGFF